MTRQQQRNGQSALEQAPDPLCYRLKDRLLNEAFPDSKPTEESLGEVLRREPGRIFELAGMKPDPWQTELFEAAYQYALVLCGRQTGKSLCAAAMAVAEALGNPPAEIIILSKAQRQSKEVLRKAKNLYLAMQGDRAAKAQIGKAPRTLAGEVTRYDQALQRLHGIYLGDDDRTQQDNTEAMTFKNGSRIQSLPGSSATTVGFSAVSLLIIDEAARTPDELFAFMSPTRATTEGKLVALSTPFGKRGWFFEQWRMCEEAKRDGLQPEWKQIAIRADQCARISKQFLDKERRLIGNMWFEQEYELKFLSVMNSVFDYDDIQKALDPSLVPLHLPGVDDGVVGSSSIVDAAVQPLEVWGVDT